MERAASDTISFLLGGAFRLPMRRKFSRFLIDFAAELEKKIGAHFGKDLNSCQPNIVFTVEENPDYFFLAAFTYDKSSTAKTTRN